MKRSSRVNQAIIAITQQIREGRIVDVEAAVIGEDVEGFVRDAVDAAYRGNYAAAKRHGRTAARRGLSTQLEIPGMGHGTLPPAVWTKDDTGRDVVIPAGQATFSQIKSEIRSNRRSVNVEDRVVSGWEATAAALEKLGVSDDWTEADIEENFGKSIMGGDDA